MIKRIQLKQTMITSIQVSGGLIPTETITLNGLETGDATNIVPTAALPGSLSEVNNNDTSGSRRVSPPALDNNSRTSVPLPVPSDPTTVVSLPSASLAASRASITAVNVLAVPSNVRTTSRLTNAVSTAVVAWQAWAAQPQCKITGTSSSGIGREATVSVDSNFMKWAAEPCRRHA